MQDKVKTDNVPNKTIVYKNTRLVRNKLDDTTMLETIFTTAENGKEYISKNIAYNVDNNGKTNSIYVEKLDTNGYVLERSIITSENGQIQPKPYQTDKYQKTDNGYMVYTTFKDCPIQYIQIFEETSSGITLTEGVDENHNNKLDGNEITYKKNEVFNQKDNIVWVEEDINGDGKYEYIGKPRQEENNLKHNNPITSLFETFTKNLKKK